MGKICRQENTDGKCADGSETESKVLFPPSRSTTSDQANDWFKRDDDEDSEVQSYNVESDVIEEATSEEVR